MRDNNKNHSILSLSRQGDELIRFIDKERVKPSDFKSEKTVILIHGFTAHGDYLEILATELINNGYNVLIYNYYSLNGILRAANSLASRLDAFNSLSEGTLEANKVSLICHSMGGLVGKSLYLLTTSRSFISSLVTIGTPHQGTLTNAKVLQHMIKAGEYLCGEYASYRPDCHSAKELIGKDNYNDIGLIKSLELKLDELKNLPVLSISGGRRYLEVGSNPILNFFTNLYIQYQLNNDNDGLVLEESSLPFSDSDIILHPMTTHQNDYADYNDVNHSYLINNQMISLNVIVWLNKLSI